MKFVIDIPDDVMNLDVVQEAIEIRGGIKEDWLLGQFHQHTSYLTNHMGIRVLKDDEHVVEGLNCEFKPYDKVIYDEQDYIVYSVFHNVAWDDKDIFIANVDLELRDDVGDYGFFVSPDDDALAHAEKEQS